MNTPTNDGPVASFDLRRAELAVAELLSALGADKQAPGLTATPGRVARMYQELLTQPAFEATTFPNDEHYDELIVVSRIPFCSLCEHHMLPFIGTACIGYLPGQRLVGLSKLARVVEYHARQLQVQERLTTQIAGWFTDNLEPRGVGVILDAEHSCMSIRGVRSTGARTVTSALRGIVRDDERTRAEFIAMSRARG